MGENWFCISIRFTVFCREFPVSLGSELPELAVRGQAEVGGLATGQDDKRNNFRVARAGSGMEFG